MRLFAGERNLGHFHVYPSVLKPGGGIVQHRHAHGHLALFGPGEWRVHAVVRGEERELALEDSSLPGFGGFRHMAFIDAEVHHRIEFVGGAETGHMACLFSRWSETGEFLPDPKETLPPEVATGIV